MAIENILNKIIASYKKKKLSFKMVSDLTQLEEGEAVQSHNSSLQVDDVVSESIYSQNSKIYKPKSQNYPCKSDKFKFEDSSVSAEILSDSYNPIMEIEDADINIIDWRAHKRKDISIPIDFTTSSDKLYKEKTKNIGPGGLFIETQRYNKLVRNQKIVMVFTIIEGRKPFKLIGKVVRVQPEGIAVRFDNISPFDSASIEEALNKMSR
ncbi:MAG: PilZ domain-containing protein [Desulfamplus sp.]|nr:PilZ domain-containing protein [Desulfamplus sp.]